MQINQLMSIEGCKNDICKKGIIFVRIKVDGRKEGQRGLFVNKTEQLGDDEEPCNGS